jgi:rod shape-determining protein MreC
LVALDARRTRLLLVVLVIVHLGVIARQVDAGGGLSLLARAVLTLVGPLQAAVAWSVRGVSGVFSGYFALRHVRQDNERLLVEVSALRAASAKNEVLAAESTRLREVLDLVSGKEGSLIPAELVTRDGVPWARTLTVNRGSDHGVALDDVVVTPSGVVGRVIARGARVAKVQLLLDRDSGVGVLIERSRVVGVVSGQAGTADAAAGVLVMKYVPPTADVVVGDLVITSGTDRIYPKGLRVGTVSQVTPGSGLFEEILVTPAVRVEELEFLAVMHPRRDAPPIFTESVR